MKIKFSEIFGNTIQGEGHYTGKITQWVRFFNCNLECNGFGQTEPTKPETYILPYQTFDLSSITNIEDLPVFEQGCDSSYSWSKKYRHLTHTEEPHTIVDRLEAFNAMDNNPHSFWFNPLTYNEYHLAFTGGEPMMNQPAMIAILEEMIDRGNYPRFVTIETNGTKPLKQQFIDFWESVYERDLGIEILWSVSPKLFTVSGEESKKAWKPETIVNYKDFIRGKHKMQIKFVVNEDSMIELEDKTKELINKFQTTRISGTPLPEFWVMPVGATSDGQDVHSVDFIKSLISKGYHISSRVHIQLFGNAIGT